MRVYILTLKQTAKTFQLSPSPRLSEIVCSFDISVFGEGCVFNMTEPTGIITTRDMYSDDNGQAAACAWIIEAPFFHVIQLQFVYIDILLSPNCRDNFIAVRFEFYFVHMY